MDKNDKDTLELLGYAQCTDQPEKYYKHVKSFDGDDFTLQIWTANPVEQSLCRGKYAAKAKYRYNSHFGFWLDDFYGDDVAVLDKKMMEDIEKYQDW